MLKNGRFISPIISCNWLYDHRDIENLIILNVGVKSSNSIDSEGHIPNARSLNIKENFSDITAKFPNTIPTQRQFEYEARQLGIHQNSILVVYDNKGIYWSPRIWWLFKTFGFDTVAVLDGGLPEWKRLGYKTSSALTSASWNIGNFSANYQPSKISFFKDISYAYGNDNILILDARSADRFHGVSPEPRLGLRSGTIPNSKNLPYTSLMNGNCLKSKTELQTIFDTFEIEEHTLIFSCGSGVTACILALAADICDYQNLSIYDGSWTEYGTLTM